MNILHMNYAVEVANSGSINKAAEALMIAQPNLSRSIKELENDLGITIFNRSPKGMTLTPQGEEFITYAKQILSQIDEIENMYKTSTPMRRKFSFCGPRATYISEAFTVFSTMVDNAPIEMAYQETSQKSVLSNVINGDFKIGVLRFDEKYITYYKSLMKEKKIHSELVTSFRYVLIMSKDSPLAKKETILSEDLHDMIEICNSDFDALMWTNMDYSKATERTNSTRKIYIYERGSQFSLLHKNTQTYMWSTPLPQDYLDMYQLVQLPLHDDNTTYRDELIYRNDYTLTAIDKQFITELIRSRRNSVRD